MDCGYIDCSAGDIRLVGGENETMGRVEVCSDRRWGTVCDNQWTNNHTAVVCRQLGFSDIIGNSIQYTSAKFGSGTGPILMDYINCTGTEANLWRKCSHFTHYYGCSHNDDVGVQCQPAYGTWRTKYGTGGGPLHTKYYECTGNEKRFSECDSYNETISRTHNDDVGIYCRPATCADGKLRLAEGETEWEGRVEICFRWRWGIIRSEIWSKTNSHVVCNDLGYDITDEMNNLSIPQALSKPVYLHNVVCSSRDLTLLECGFTRDSGNTTNIQDAIVKCQQPSCDDGDLKLVGGESENEGRLEVCFNKRWGTIDEDGWTHTDTQVACGQLGFSPSDVSHTRSTRTSQSLPVYMTLVGCYSSEERLIDCAYHDFIGSKSTSMDVSISCGSISAEDSTEKSDELNSVSVASLSVAVICASALIILVALLIIRHMLRQKKKKSTISNEPPTQQLHNTDTGYRYHTEHFNKGATINEEKMDYEMHDVPMDSYEEVIVNTPVIPPKPKTKTPPKKPNVNTPNQTRYVRSSEKQNVRKPATMPQMRPQFHGRVQQQPQVCSESPEIIYDVPD